MTWLNFELQKLREGGQNNILLETRCILPTYICWEKEVNFSTEHQSGFAHYVPVTSI